MDSTAIRDDAGFYQVVAKAAYSALQPPRQFEPGTILTLRMRGHSRSPVPGSEYFAPAVVLEQFAPNGEISVLIWDSSAGTHYNASYPIRDVSSRGNGNEREMYEVQSNIGQVLFSPREFGRMTDDVEQVVRTVAQFRSVLRDLNSYNGSFAERVEARLTALESFMAEMKAPPVAVANETAVPNRVPNQPKIAAK